MLSGYKTYLFAAAIGAIAVLHYLGFIGDELTKALEAVFTGGGLAALRASISK